MKQRMSTPGGSSIESSVRHSYEIDMIAVTGMSRRVKGVKIEIILTTGWEIGPGQAGRSCRDSSRCNVGLMFMIQRSGAKAGGDEKSVCGRCTFMWNQYSSNLLASLPRLVSLASFD